MKPPCPLDNQHDRSSFDCGYSELNEYLQRFAGQNQTKGSARTYVVLDGERVVAYYTLVVGSVEWKDCPDDVRKGLGRYPVPVIVIGRLAVDRRFQRKGLGIGLIKDAFARSLQVSDLVGVVAILVDAKDEQAKNYYESKRLGFKSMPGEPLKLYLPIKVIRANF